MPGLFDLIQQLSGHPDPMAQLAAFGQGQGQPSPPPSASPAPSPPAAGPGVPPGPPQPPPQPQAYTSPPDLLRLNAALAQAPQPQQQPPPGDLTSLYLQMAQRSQANETFNRGAGLLAASMYPGRRPDLIMNAMTGQTQDPGALMNSIMSIQNFQRQQQQYQQIQGAAPGLAKQLNVDLPTAQAIIASGKYGDVESTLAGVSGDPTIQQMHLDQRNFVSSHTDPNTGRLTEPVPDYLSNIEKYKGQMATEVTTAHGKAQDLLSATHDFTTQNQSFNQAEGLLNNLLKPDAPLDEITKNIIPATGVGGVLKSNLPSWAPGSLSEAGGQAASDLQQLKSIVYSKAFQSTGSRRTQQEVSRLSDALSQLDNPNLTAKQLRDQLINIQGITRQAHANIYGAAGQTAPDDYFNLMDPIYKPKGELYAGATGGGAGGFVGAAPAAPAPAAPAASGRVKKYNPATGNIE